MGEKELPQDHHYVVISSDDHGGADLYAYKPYLEKKWHDEFDEWAANYSNPWDFVEARASREDFDVEKEELLAGVASWHSPLNWNSSRRKSDLQSEGVVAEVIFPNTAPPFMAKTVLSGLGPLSRPEYELRFAGLRAHNRWLADFCSQAPDRGAGFAPIFLDDIDAAVAEVRWAKQAGLRGVLLPN